MKKTTIKKSEVYKHIDDVPLLMTQDELTDLLRISYSVLYRWKKRGVPVPKPIRIGDGGRSFMRYHKNDVMEWLESARA